MKGLGLSFQVLTQFRMSASRACTLRWSLRWSTEEVLSLLLEFMAFD